MQPIVIRRWTRYGNDRAYARSQADEPLGYMDLATREIHPEAGVDLDKLSRALNAYADSIGITAAGSVAAVPPVQIPGDTAPSVAAPTVPAPPVPLRADLSAHRPGELVRQQAASAWQARKADSKFKAYVGRALNVHTDERAWRVGAEGEEFIGEKLNKLVERGWRVLHSVPVGAGDSDIDHVVIGPGGVFTVNSKNHPGGKIWVAQYQMRVNGQPVPYLRNARHEAARASKLLSAKLGATIPVRSCVVVLTGSIIPEINYKQMPDDVNVLHKWNTPRWFRKQPVVYSEEQVEAIYEVARWSDTWA